VEDLGKWEKEENKEKKESGEVRWCIVMPVEQKFAQRPSKKLVGG